MRQPGQWIHGKYRVERVLGSGGMGVVYATRRRNESRAAVKVLHPRFARDKTVRARFLEEGYTANRVGHPAVVTILEDDIDEEGNFYLVMDLLDGVDLGKFVGPPRTPITIAQALNIAGQLLSALAKAHQKGIIHCDIKPQNVMILRDGRVLLLDFGIAKAFDANRDPGGNEDDIDEEEDEAVFGTDRYMSPEQGQGSFQAIDARTDIWAVGALLLALLADHDPSAPPLWDQSYEERAWVFSRLGPNVPPHVVQIISLALQPQKEKRWASASDMKDAVRKAHDELYGPASRDALAELSAQFLGPLEDDEDLPPAEFPAASPIEPTVQSHVEPTLQSPVSSRSDSFESQPRSSQPRSSQPRSSQPRSSQPRSSRPQPSAPGLTWGQATPHSPGGALLDIAEGGEAHTPHSTRPLSSSKPSVASERKPERGPSVPLLLTAAVFAAVVLLWMYARTPEHAGSKPPPGPVATEPPAGPAPRSGQDGAFASGQKSGDESSNQNAQMAPSTQSLMGSRASSVAASQSSSEKVRRDEKQHSLLPSTGKSAAPSSSPTPAPRSATEARSTEISNSSQSSPKGNAPPEPVDVPKSRCNGLDGIFDVEECP